MTRFIYFLAILALTSCNSDKISKKLLDKNEDLINVTFYFIKSQYFLNPAKTEAIYLKSERLLGRYKILEQQIEFNQINKDSVQNYLTLLFNFGVISKDLSSPIDLNLKNGSILIYQIQNLTYQGLQNFKWMINEDQHVTNLTKIVTIKKNDFIEIFPVSIDSNYLPNIMIGKLRENENRFENSFIRPDLNNQIKIRDLKKIDLNDKIEGLYIIETFGGESDTIRFNNRME